VSLFVELIYWSSIIGKFALVSTRVCMHAASLLRSALRQYAREFARMHEKAGVLLVVCTSVGLRMVLFNQTLFVGSFPIACDGFRWRVSSRVVRCHVVCKYSHVDMSLKSFRFYEFVLLRSLGDDSLYVHLLRIIFPDFWLVTAHFRVSPT
jgi:hypothetical protein